MAFGKLSSVIQAVAGQALVPTGKTFGNKKRKGMGGMLQKAVEKVAPEAGGGGARADDDEGGGILSTVKRAVRRKAY